MYPNEYNYFEFKDRPTTKSYARRSCSKILIIIRRYVLSLDLKKSHGYGDILIIEDVSTHTQIQKHEVRRCLNILSKEGIISKQFDFDRYDKTGNPSVFSIAFDDIKWDGSKWVKIKYDWVKSMKGNNYTCVEKGIKTKWNGRGYTVLFDSYEYKSALVLELATHEIRRKSNFVCKRCKSMIEKPTRKHKHGHSIEKCNVSVVKNILEM